MNSLTASLSGVEPQAQADINFAEQQVNGVG